MIARIVELSLIQRVMVCILGFLLFFGGLYAFHTLDIVAYPDPSPPMIELITQQPGWSAEEVERQITVPIEVALNGMPGLTDIRSLSIFGLSDIKIYFNIKSKGVVVGGYSSGGDLTYRTAFYHADIFAGVIVENSSPYRDTGSTQAASLANPGPVPSKPPAT